MIERLRRIWRHYWPAQQTGRCAECGLVIVERRRHPCSSCGARSRIFIRSMAAADLASRDGFDST